MYTLATIQLDAGSSGGCAADLNADGTVGADDLAALINGWGGTSPDLSGDGIVTAEDLAVMLSAWGACP